MIDRDTFLARLRTKCLKNAARGNGCSCTYSQCWALTAPRISGRPGETTFDAYLLELLKSGEICVADGRFWVRGIMAVVTSSESCAVAADPRQIALWESAQ